MIAISQTCNILLDPHVSQTATQVMCVDPHIDLCARHVGQWRMLQVCESDSQVLWLLNSLA